ncbi:MAG TPA: nickel-binding protein [Candidatus Acidoferrum sp.]|nr:nickel-binding protein [Candidatus Acidoferrum sp.]
MSKFMCTHTIPPGKFSADQMRQMAQAAQQDATVKGYRSFANLAEGKAVCVMEAPNKDAVAAWFNKMGMPFDNITKVEFEGERGNIQHAA